MRKIIIINGGGGVGKDTFVRLCQNVDPTIQNLSSVDYVREVAHELGWSGEKDDKARRFLSDLKRAMMLYNGAPFYKVFETINDFDKNATVFLHVREPDEIELYKNQINANCDKVVTLLIRNNRVNAVTTNPSDANVTEYGYDYIIDNNGTLQELQDSAELFVEMLNDDRKGN